MRWLVLLFHVSYFFFCLLEWLGRTNPDPLLWLPFSLSFLNNLSLHIFFSKKIAMKRISVTLKGIAALSQHQYYAIRKGKPCVTAKGRAYRLAIQNALKDKVPEKMVGKVKLTMLMCFKDNKPRDLDNCFKGFIDSIKDVIMGD